MVQVDYRDVAAELAKLLEQVEGGETVVLLKSGRPVAEIRPAASADAAPRPVGLAKGTFVVPPSFFEPMPDDFIESFSGGDR